MRRVQRAMIVRVALLVCLMMACTAAQVTAGAGFKKGLDAYNKEDFATALIEFKRLAEQGYALAQSNLGLMYAEGKGVPKDYNEAFKLFSKAAEQGYDVAQSNLGLLYLEGKGVPKDYNEAFKLFSKAAEQGYAGAQYHLGLMYAEGKGVSKDDKFAYVWISLAAKEGNIRVIPQRDRLAKRLTPKALSEAQEIASNKYAQIEASKKNK